jgi:hypothetical protein
VISDALVLIIEVYSYPSLEVNQKSEICGVEVGV